MSLTLGPLQAVTNAQENYDYCWMKTVVDNIAVDEKGRSCRLVQNDDQWHFDQQLLRYRSGLHLAITSQKQLDDFLRHGWLKLTDNPVIIHRFKVDLQQAVDWERARRTALLECLDEWRDGQDTKYTTGHGMEYFFECRGDEAAERVRSRLSEFGLTVEPWGPQFVPVESQKTGATRR
jgi:hypothetical protein